MMDDIIREAAAQQDPAANSDMAWNKMRLQLDEYLPQRRRGKRYLLLLFALLISGGVILYATLFHNSDTTEDDHPTTAQQSTVGGTPAAVPTGDPVATATTPANTTSDQPGNTAAASSTPPSVQGTNTPRSGLDKRSGSRIVINSGDPSLDLDRSTPDGPFNRKGKTKVRISATTPSTEDEPDQDSKVYVTTTNIDPEMVTNAPLPDPAITGAIPADSIKQTDVTAGEIKKEVTTQKDTTAAINKTTATAPAKKSRRFADNFAITLTGGIDLSYVRAKEPGKRALLYGAGLSYTVGKHFRFSAGFYVTDKIYATDPADYHPPADFWTAYPDLAKVDANCRVQEIPVSIAYHFGARAKHSWFAGIGVSSLLMKTEDYTYLYKLPNGQFRGRKWYYENENQHFLSTLTLSGGYQYFLNKRVSFLAEPYFKMPLKGIGFGRIRLNSIGMAVTAVVRPF